MRKLIVAAILIIVSIAGLTVAGLQVYNLYYPQEATVGAYGLESRLDGYTWANGTKISWGTIQAGQSYTKKLNVTNTGAFSVKVGFVALNMPAGWTETWAQNGTTLSPNMSTEGDLTLTVPSNATLTTHTWDSYVTGEKP